MIELKRNPKNPLNDYPAQILLDEIEELREGLVQRMMMADTAAEAEICRHQVKCVSEILGLSDRILHKLTQGEIDE